MTGTISASLLPQASQQFLDSNGDPLVSGVVTLEVPGTGVLKEVWKDPYQSVELQNPVTLDGAGRAQIYGNGQYQMIVTDQFGTVQFSGLTDDFVSEIAETPQPTWIPAVASGINVVTLTPVTTPPEGFGYSQGLSLVFVAAQTSTAVITLAVQGPAGLGTALPLYLPDGETRAGAQALVSGQQYAIAYNSALNSANGGWQFIGQPASSVMVIANPSVPLATSIGNAIPSLNVEALVGTTEAVTEWENISSQQMQNNVGGTGVISTSANKVVRYAAMEVGASGGNSWVDNRLLMIDAGALPAGGGQIVEDDMINNSGTHYGDSLGFAGVEQPAVFGSQMTGAGTYRVTAAYAILGTLPGNNPLWNRGIVAGPFTIKQSFLEDYSAATRSYMISGSHSYGIDFYTGATEQSSITQAAIRFAAQQGLKVINNAGTAGTTDLTTLVTDANDRLYVGSGPGGVQPTAGVFVFPVQIGGSYTSDAAAAIGGIAVGELYRNGSVVQIRVT